jgi:hypothetical protein
MKTKEQVLEHLAGNGYAPYASEKVMGFLLGNGIIEKKEVVTFRKGNLLFDDFYEWFNKEGEAVVEVRGMNLIINVGKNCAQILALSNIVNGKLLGFNGTKVKVYDVEKFEFPTEEEMIPFIENMAEKGFGYLEHLGGFFLLDELCIEECDEEEDEINEECEKCPRLGKCCCTKKEEDKE